jgi:hypothetical protein
MLSVLQLLLVIVLTVLFGMPQVTLAWGDQQSNNNYGEVNNDPRAVHISQVRQLVFREGAMTEGMRSRVPQLKCVSGQCHQGPGVVHCQVTGNSHASGDPLWKCDGELPVGLRFGATDVVCEGFRYPEDEFVTKNSCGLEYSLVGHVQQQQQQQQQGGSWFGGGGNSWWSRSQPSRRRGWFSGAQDYWDEYAPSWSSPKPVRHSSSSWGMFPSFNMMFWGFTMWLIYRVLFGGGNRRRFYYQPEAGTYTNGDTQGWSFGGNGGLFGRSNYGGQQGQPGLSWVHDGTSRQEQQRLRVPAATSTNPTRTRVRNPASTTRHPHRHWVR